ncbi:MAG: ribosome silencing factor [Bacteroidales bacterium]|nr:ribosome silencing factor [Bacteroidales bacterium]MCD8386217.1 ribosome silencing factor [Bacteroidales bacterium]
MTQTTQLPNLIIDAIQDRKGKNITLVDMSQIESAPTQLFIIAEGNSTQQVAAIADNIREKVQEKSGVKPYNYDGYSNSEWIIIDYGWAMVHVFLPTERQRYNLEELWSDAAIEDVPNLD